MNQAVVGELASACSTRAGDELAAELERRARVTPRCAATRYVLGCVCFDRGRPAQAVRHMMLAHHIDAALESAALLVFAGLLTCRVPDQPLLSVVLEAWDAHGRPAFDRRRRERLLLDHFAAPLDNAADYSPLARRLWRLPIGLLRRQLRSAVRSEVPDQRVALLLPA